MIPTKPEEYVPRFASALRLGGEVQLKSIEILKEAGEQELVSGRGPTGVAAAAIYIAATMAGERRTQREVAEVAGVTEVTIRNRYKELIVELGLEIKFPEDEAREGEHKPKETPIIIGGPAEEPEKPEEMEKPKEIKEKKPAKPKKRVKPKPKKVAKPRGKKPAKTGSMSKKASSRPKKKKASTRKRK